MSLLPAAEPGFRAGDGREVRYLDPFLTGERLSDTRRWPLADADALSLEQAYLTAREAVARTVRAELNTRQHQAQARWEVQTGRVQRYYADLRVELAERLDKLKARGEETQSLRSRVHRQGILHCPECTPAPSRPRT